MKNKKGFTLIELLAVIIILGVIMLIAIPSVTRYINDSRKRSYIDTAKQYIKGTTVLVNSGELDVYDTDVTYYVPSSCIKLESGGKSPYGGDFSPAYVLVTYNNDSFNFYWMSTDSQNVGIKTPTLGDKLDIKSIETGVSSNDVKPIIGVDGRRTIIEFTSDCLSTKEPVRATTMVDGKENGGDINKREFDCEAGTYLPQGETECTDCTVGSYCTGGTFHFSENNDQGIERCAQGSYSKAQASSCTVCSAGNTTSSDGASYCNKICSNRNGVGRWQTPAWNNNVVSNLCTISSCTTSPSGIYSLDNNVCKATGTFYAKWWDASISDNYDLANYRDITFTTYTVNINNYNKPESGGYKSYAFFKIEVVNNIVINRYLCFGITSAMNISGARIGFYCLKAKAGDATYQENKRVLQSAFTNYSSYCTDNGTKYECKNYTSWIDNGKFLYYVTKDGEVYACYDEPVEGLEKPEYYVTLTKFGRYSGGCLSGDTIVDVYDRRKKKKLRKKLRDVTYDDLILCWDFETGTCVYVEPLWIKKMEISNRYYLLEFSDGSELKIIGDHKVFDADRNKFVNAGAENELEIGSHVFNSKGQLVELVSWKIIEDEIDYYNVITNHHMNIFTNGILTSCVFSNINSVKDLKYINDSKEVLTDEDLKGIDKKYIEGLRLNEVPNNFRGNKEETIKYVRKYIDMLISKEK